MPLTMATWQKELRYWLEWLGVALCVRIIPLLPLALLRLLADIAGWLLFHLDRKSRAVALANPPGRLWRGTGFIGSQDDSLSVVSAARPQLSGAVLDSETERQQSRS